MDKYKIPNVKTFEFTKIVGIDKISFGRDIIIDDFVLLYATAPMKIGNHVHIACFASITGGAEFVIEDYSAVSQGVRILTATDDFKDWGFGNSTIETKYRNVTRSPIRIGRFCIIGSNSVVLPGVTIGEGATIGACSVVSRDVAPWGVYVGNRKIGERNKKEVLKKYADYVKEFKE